MDNINREKTWQKCLFRIQMDRYIYKYIIIKSRPSDECYGETYGIKIQKVNLSNEEIESKIVEDISSDKNRTVRIIDLLKRFRVTPVTLEDVIVDSI